jgi:hypothetical protein
MTLLTSDLPRKLITSSREGSVKGLTVEGLGGENGNVNNHNFDVSSSSAASSPPTLRAAADNTNDATSETNITDEGQRLLEK